MRTYFRVRASFGKIIDGAPETFIAGEIVPSDAPVLKNFNKAALAEHFEPVTSFGRWDVEQATKAPGEKR